jgi:hypothetical protein
LFDGGWRMANGLKLHRQGHEGHKGREKLHREGRQGREGNNS